MKSLLFAVSAALLAVAASEEETPEMPAWAMDATSLAMNLSVGLFLPESLDKNPKEIGMNASFTVDEEKEYMNFEMMLTKGVAYAEKMVFAAVPEPDDDADLPDGVESKDDLWDMLGLTGNESFTLKVRFTKEHFSMAIVVKNASSPLMTMCVQESMEDLGKDAADAFESLPEGFDLHDGEPHPHKDEEHVEKELKGVMPKDAKAAEKALKDEVKKDVKKGGDDEIKGDDTYTVDTGDMLKQLQGNVDEVPEDMQVPFTVEVFTDKTTGKPTNVLMLGTDGETKGAKIWVNITNLTVEGVPTSAEPVCKDPLPLDEGVQAMMPEPQRRLLEHAVKLRALESVNGALSVVRTLRPRTRAPADATQLWNSKDLEAAKMERYLFQRMHAERKMWRAAHAQLQRKSQILLAGSGLLLVVMGLATFAVARSRSSRLTADSFELLPRSDSEVA